MRDPGNKTSLKESGKSGYSNSLAKIISSPKFRKGGKFSHVKKLKPKPKTIVASSLSKTRDVNSSSKGSRNNDGDKNLMRRKGFHKVHDTNSSKKLSSVKQQDEKVDEKGDNPDGEVKVGLKKRRKKKSQKHKVELDEPSRLKRRTRYLLIKIKLEQNLIDAYAGEGWKGQSREKIRPEKELQRAQKQILKCKLGIREAIHQLDSLSSVGSIADSVIAPDGSVSHEHIFCAKCKLREAFLDNDIILCDGTCNCAYHQKCLDPPLDTENIPRGEQGWFCKFCECKMDILEVVNAHLGTCFSMDSSWQDVFKEEAAFPDGENSLLNPGEEWPSDDSEDDDYNPDRNENSCSFSRGATDDNASDDELSTDVSVCCSDGSTDGEIVSGGRQRRLVDYKKLYDEMFGKDGPLHEQISDDEDWGPGKRKRREKESDAASTLMTLYESKRTMDVPTEVKNKRPSDMQVRRACFRIPRKAVEKLRQVFSENELPSRAVKENLSKELGLDPGKVTKWFKNARYLALKTRKGEGAKNDHTFTPGISKESRYENVAGKAADLMPSDSDDCLAETVAHSPNNVKKSFRRKHPKSLSSPLRKNQQKGSSCGSPAKSNKDGIELSDDVSLKKLLKARTKEKRANVVAGDEGGCRVAELEMERLCKAKGRLENMKQQLQKFQHAKAKKLNKSLLHGQSVVYVPIAELMEKN